MVDFNGADMCGGLGDLLTLAMLNTSVAITRKVLCLNWLYSVRRQLRRVFARGRPTSGSVPWNLAGAAGQAGGASHSISVSAAPCAQAKVASGGPRSKGKLLQALTIQRHSIKPGVLIALGHCCLRKLASWVCLNHSGDYRDHSILRDSIWRCP